MTCIIGLIDKDKMYMMGDSAGVSNLNVRIRKDKKVFERKIQTLSGEMPILIGFTTSFRMGQILMYCDLPLYDENDDPFEYLVKDFAPSIISSFKDEGFLRSYDKDDKDQKKGGTFLIAFANRLFTIEEDFQVAELEEMYGSIGCGSIYAWPSLQTINKIKPDMFPIKAMKMAMEIAEKNSGGVCQPFNLISV